MSLVGLASCDMDAPSISTLDESSVFATYSLAESEVMSIHVSFGETNSYRGRFLPYYGVNTDVEWGNAPSFADRVSDKQSLWNYSTLPGNGQMNTANNAYAKFYEGIERANLAIKGIRQYGNIENNANMRHLCCQYLATLPSTHKGEKTNWQNVPRMVEGSKVSVFRKKMATPLANVGIFYSADIPFTPQADLELDFLTRVLKIAYTDSVREEKGHGCSGSPMSAEPSGL